MAIIRPIWQPGNRSLPNNSSMTTNEAKPVKSAKEQTFRGQKRHALYRRKGRLKDAGIAAIGNRTAIYCRFLQKTVH